MKQMIVLLLALLAAPALAQGFDHSHKAWDALLKKHVVLVDGGGKQQDSHEGVAFMSVEAFSEFRRSGGSAFLRLHRPD